MLEALKKEVCEANKNLPEYGLTLFSFGNASAIDREKNLVAIKPSGVPFAALRPEDIVIVDLEGKVVEGNLKPSSDTPAHLELYRSFKGIGAIVHTHSTHATIFAQAKLGIDCLGTTHADEFYGSVPVTRDMRAEEVASDYEQNTGLVIVEHFRINNLEPLKMPACLVASHGPFVWADTPEKALHKAVVLEQVAKMKIETLRLNPGIKVISRHLLDKHYFRKHGNKSYYGQPR